MSSIFYIIVNAGLVLIFFLLMRKKDYLSFLEGGRWWLTWLAVGIITLMDEMTSIFYAPFEGLQVHWY
jgi:hypothetical protein